MQKPINTTKLPVIGIPINLCNEELALQNISNWANGRESRYICICNAHSIVTASQDDNFRKAILNADIATPDGAPVAWMLSKLSGASQPRVSGPDLMLSYCAAASDRSEAIFLYGSTPETLEKLQSTLLTRWPNLHIAGAISPPFRALSTEEDDAIVNAINASGAGTVWVSLGCPKQELWMASHAGRVNAVMIGVGAAFDFHAGTVTRAPLWMRNIGLEWLHRLASEPRRLWRRYLVTNSLFILGAARQLLTGR